MFAGNRNRGADCYQALEGRSPEIFIGQKSIRMPITYLDGPRLKHAVIAGAQRLIQMQEQLNDINVFPVADSDTGTNMALTMRCVAEGALSCKESSVFAVSEALADSALMGARGNSGAILAQFFQGLSEGLRGKSRIDLAGFAKAVQHASESAREAIAEPREGTILTVIHDWAEHIHEIRERVSDFRAMIRSSLCAASDSLQRTPEKLKTLAKAGVVDAGAQGFVHLLEGAQTFIQSGRIERLARGVLSFGHVKARVDEAPEEIKFQYCTQAMVVGTNIDRAALKQKLRPLGDSMIVAGSSQRVRVHIHTNVPEQVFSIVSEYGSLIDRKKDDMRGQHSRAHHDPQAQTLALITDSACDLPADEMIQYNIRMVPVVVIFGNKTYVDKVSITDRDFYKLLSESVTHPTTSQPSPADFQAVYSQAAGSHRQAIAIILSGALSGTLQAAQYAAKVVRDEINIEVIDSKNVTAGLGLIVREAAEAIESGASLQEVRDRIHWAIRNVRVYLNLETMKYLVRSGRISKLRGVAAKLLNLRVILTLNSEGRLEAIAKAITRKRARRKLMEIVKREATGKRNLRFLVAHASAPETAIYYAEQLRKIFEIPEVPIVPVSPALGAHAGPGAAGIAFLGEER